MSARKFWLGLCLGLAALSPVACAANTDAAEASSPAEEALTAAAEKLIGSYEHQAGSIHGLVLTGEKVGQQAKFFADVDTGIRCNRAPCPSAERIEGTWSAGEKSITLRSETATGFVAHLLGKYKYEREGRTLLLAKDGDEHRVTEATSYCAADADCYRQNITTPSCFGLGFTCAENSCQWHCGAPPPLNPCTGKDVDACIASSACQPEFGPSACSPGGVCTADMAYKGCVLKKEHCSGLDEDACKADSACEADYGSSCPFCADWSFRGCSDK